MKRRACDETPNSPGTMPRARRLLRLQTLRLSDSRPWAAVALGAMFVVCAACQTAGPPPPATSGAGLGINLPSPLTGPGRGMIDTTERKAVAGAWNHLLSGRTNEALATVARFDSPQAELLRYQTEVVGGVSAALQARLEDFVDGNSQYAAGWVTFSITAEMQDDEPAAMTAALESSRLWPSGPFAGRADDLYQRWVTDRVERGNQMLSEGLPMEALSITEQALGLDPDNQSALLTRAEALVQLQQGPEAEAALAQLGALPEALVLRGDLAASQGNWQHAMTLFEALPEGYPAREKSLRRAQLMWRMSILPPHVQEAVQSKAVTRGQLAVIILATVPSLEIHSGGSTPLMTDIIDLPSQRAILTATRLDIMSTDRVARLFHPQRPASGEESKAAIEAVCHLSGYAPPLWCDTGMDDTDDCILIEEPVLGTVLLEILLSVDVGANT